MMSHHAETRGIYLFAQYTIVPQKPSYATWTNLYKSTLGYIYTIVEIGSRM